MTGFRSERRALSDRRSGNDRRGLRLASRRGFERRVVGDRRIGVERRKWLRLFSKVPFPRYVSDALWLIPLSRGEYRDKVPVFDKY